MLTCNNMLDCPVFWPKNIHQVLHRRIICSNDDKEDLRRKRNNKAITSVNARHQKRQRWRHNNASNEPQRDFICWMLSTCNQKSKN